VRALNVAQLHGRYARLLLWPDRLSADWGFACLPLITVPGDGIGGGGSRSGTGGLSSSAEGSAGNDAGTGTWWAAAWRARWDLAPTIVMYAAMAGMCLHGGLAWLWSLWRQRQHRQQTGGCGPAKGSGEQFVASDFAPNDSAMFGEQRSAGHLSRCVPSLTPLASLTLFPWSIWGSRVFLGHVPQRCMRS
jgi:hypothetical protein